MTAYNFCLCDYPPNLLSLLGYQATGAGFPSSLPSAAAQIATPSFQGRWLGGRCFRDG